MIQKKSGWRKMSSSRRKSCSFLERTKAAFSEVGGGNFKILPLKEKIQKEGIRRGAGVSKKRRSREIGFWCDGLWTVKPDIKEEQQRGGMPL